MLESQYEEAKRRRTEIEELFRDLQKEHSEFVTTYSERIRMIDVDPFDHPSFVDFLNQMIAKNWVFETIRECNQKVDELGAKKAEIEEKTKKYVEMKPKYEEMIEDKRKKIRDLELQFNQLRLQIGQYSREAPKQEYREGAPHIVFDEERIVDLEEDQTGIWLMFTSYTLLSGFPGEGVHDIMLSIEFYEHEVKNSYAQKATSGKFDFPLLYICRNDFQLREYVNTAVAHAIIYSVHGMKFEVIATGDISLTPFGELSKEQKFTSTIPLIGRETGGHVGDLVYEAAIYPHPLYT
jgi:hypothetical protein